MNFMHLDNSRANTPNEHRLLVDCLYREELNSVLELIKHYRQKLELAYSYSPSTRIRLRLAALKNYYQLCKDEEFLAKCIEEILNFIATVHEMFPEIIIKPEGRFKAFISWYNKCTKVLDDQISIEKLNDNIAFRFVVESKNQELSEEQLVNICYEIVNIMITHFITLGCVPCEAENVRDIIKLSSARLKEIYVPEASGIDPYYVSVVKDYILTPKENGYQSLHTIFRMPNGLTFEVQVRTVQMDTYATEGYGHHGRYKESRYTNCVNYDPQLVKGQIFKEAGFDQPRIFTF